MSELENKETEGCGCEHKHEHEHHHKEGCGCEHKHEHEHHHEEGCGCEHKHEHEHHHEEGCGCGHDHEHKHHHEEGCGCEHKHEHEHHHEEGCGCGHDHEHEHQHEEGCGCGHDHGHEHHHHDEGHKYDIPGYKLVETHKHEGATICSFECDTKLSGEEARKAMEDAFEAVKTWLNDNGAVIGHVKGYIKENGPTVTFSTVGAAMTINDYEAAGSSVGFASIVFGPDEETLKDVVIKEFARLQ